MVAMATTQIVVSVIYLLGCYGSNWDCTSQKPPSTCELLLRIPTAHGGDYEKFKEHLFLGFKGNDGFGAV